MEDVPTLAAAGVEELHFGSAATVDGRTDAEAVGRLVAQARATAGGTLGPG